LQKNLHGSKKHFTSRTLRLQRLAEEATGIDATGQPKCLSEEEREGDIPNDGPLKKVFQKT